MVPAGYTRSINALLWTPPHLKSIGGSSSLVGGNRGRWQVGYDTGAKSISAQITQSPPPAEVKSVVGKIVNISGATSL